MRTWNDTKKPGGGLHTPWLACLPSTMKFQWDHSGEHLFVQRRGPKHFYPVSIEKWRRSWVNQRIMNVLTPASLIQLSLPGTELRPALSSCAPTTAAFHCYLTPLTTSLFMSFGFLASQFKVPWTDRRAYKRIITTIISTQLEMENMNIYF